MTSIKSIGSIPRHIDRDHTMRKLLNTCQNTDQFLRNNNDKQIWKDSNNEMNSTFHMLFNKKKYKKSNTKIVKLKDCMNSEAGIYNETKYNK